MRDINLIIIHCSGTRDGRELTPDALEADHRRRGFITTGYHYYIRRDGTVVCTRPVEQVGAHCRGHNAHSIGICYEGGLDAEGRPADTRTEKQRRELRRLVCRLLRKYPDCLVRGHRDMSPDVDGDGVVEPEEWTKVCPSFDVLTEF